MNGTLVGAFFVGGERGNEETLHYRGFARGGVYELLFLPHSFSADEASERSEGNPPLRRILYAKNTPKASDLWGVLLI